MISDQSTSLFMLRSNALAQQITLLSCSLFLVSSILFLPIVNRHPVDTVLIPFANIEKYPLNVGSLGFGIGGCLAVVNTLFLEWAKRHEGQRADRESQEFLALLSSEKQNMIRDCGMPVWSSAWRRTGARRQLSRHSCTKRITCRSAR